MMMLPFNSLVLNKLPIRCAGYYFRKSVANGTGTAQNFIVVAYPAQYRFSGVMTFVMSQSGRRRKGFGTQTNGNGYVEADRSGHIAVAEYADTLVEHLVKNRDHASMERRWRDVCGT